MFFVVHYIILYPIRQRCIARSRRLEGISVEPKTLHFLLLRVWLASMHVSPNQCVCIHLLLGPYPDLFLQVDLSYVVDLYPNTQSWVSISLPRLEALVISSSLTFITLGDILETQCLIAIRETRCILSVLARVLVSLKSKYQVSN